MTLNTRGLIITLLLLGSLIAMGALTQTIVFADEATVPDTLCHESRGDRESCAKNTSDSHHACGSQNTCTKASGHQQCDT
jgi:hypothetical protein